MNKFNFDKVVADMRYVKAGLMRDIARISLKHFDQSFPNKGFTDESFSPWKPRKIPQPYPILQKTGKMRRGNYISFLSLAKAVISNDVFYAKFQNFGVPERNLPARPFIKNSSALDIKCIGLIDATMRKILFR